MLQLKLNINEFAIVDLLTSFCAVKLAWFIINFCLFIHLF